jgi:hypothetical protein
VVPWLLLPEEQGYRFNAGNWPQAVGHYAAFQPLSEDENVRGLRLAPQVGNTGEMGFPAGDL